MKRRVQANASLDGEESSAGASIKEALLASKTYRKFRYAFRELTGFNIGLDHSGSHPERFPERLFEVRIPVPPTSSADILLVAYSQHSNGRSHRASLPAFKLLQIFAKHLALISNQASLRGRDIEPPLIRRAKTYIEENYTTDLSLASMAKVLGISRFYLCKLFKKATGRTLSTYVTQRRIERAKQLLLNPTARISEIAFEVGFQSLTHFNRAFRTALGHSPTEYRKDVSLY